MDVIKQFFLAVPFLVFCNESMAYETTTHARITKEAVLRSVLNDPAVLYRIGLFPELPLTRVHIPSTDVYSFKPNSKWSADAIVWYATVMEDAGHRSLQHFFDPSGDRPLQVRTHITETVNVGMRSDDWALKGASNNPVFVEPPNQAWSLADARQHLLDAIVARSAVERDSSYGNFLAAMGHVVHHIQDMAQPDHVRNDVHCDAYLACGLLDDLSPDKLYDPSAYERQIRTDGYALYDTDNSQPVQFASYESFWSNSDGAGIADFTNQFAVSPSTNFRGTVEAAVVHPEFPVPPVTDWVVEDTQQVVTTYRGFTVGFTSTVVRSPFDDVVSGLVGSISHETSTYSIYSPDIIGAVAEGLSIVDFPDAAFSLNARNYRSTAQHLLPRAEAYTIGFIDFMLRGQIGVKVSERGYYSLADQSDSEGFRRIRVQLRNETPTVTPPVGWPIEQTMGAGTITAVASYRVNGCYQNDLRGDLHIAEDETGYFPNGCNWDTWGEGETIHVASQPVSVTDLGTDWTEMEFDFSSEPIPFSALSLEMYFVFRGELGAEPDDIAIARHDISEPTYVNVMNSTDWWWNVDEWVDASTLLNNDVNWDDDRRAQLVESELEIDGEIVAFGPVSSGRYQRLAVLTDVDRAIEFSGSVEPSVWQPVSPIDFSYSINPVMNQTRPVKVPFLIFDEIALYRYVDEWCDLEGNCTLSGLDIERGVSNWGNIDTWISDGFPTDEQLQAREPVDSNAVDGIIAID